MSPLPLRRYRAERMLRRDFRALRARVLRAVRARLRAVGIHLDGGDLEACYASAWAGLYEVTLAGQEIANPLGWLVVVTHRRAIEEHRAQIAREAKLGAAAPSSPDIDEELERRRRLRQLIEGMRGRLDAREREAAALCYLHGYSRAEAAQRMGISAARMRKLMEGANGRAGVAGKVGSLVETIRDESFCEQQASLMRALAYGLLDPDGERYRLALMHRGDCPACRAYVSSLRGLAVALPPSLFATALVGAVGAAWHRGPLRLASASRRVVRPVSASGSASLPGATIAGAGSGGWLMGAGSLGAKLAAGCLLTMTIGAGCVALGTGQPPLHDAHRSHELTQAGCRCRPRGPVAQLAVDAGAEPVSHPASAVSQIVRPGAEGSRASREFGLERAASISPRSASASPAFATQPVTLAHAASRRASGAAFGLIAASARRGGASGAGQEAAAREFGP